MLEGVEESNEKLLVGVRSHDARKGDDSEGGSEVKESSELASCSLATHCGRLQPFTLRAISMMDVARKSRGAR